MWSSPVRIVTFSLFFTFVATFFAALEPFGIDDAVKRQSRDTLYRALAPGYERAPLAVEQFGAATDGTEAGPQWPGVESPSARPGQGRENIATVYISESVINQMRDEGTAPNPG